MAPKTHPNDDPTKTDTVTTPPQDSAQATQAGSAQAAEQQEAVGSPAS
jgi:hypothetical protein